MGFFLTVSLGGHEDPHYNLVVIVLIIMQFGTGVKLDVFYTMVAKKICDLTTIISLLCHNLYLHDM